MATKNNINPRIMVKEINGQRWICENIILTDSTQHGDYDFIDNADGLLWKKVRPWRASDLKNPDILGQSQPQDDDTNDGTNNYTNDEYGDFFDAVE